MFNENVINTLCEQQEKLLGEGRERNVLVVFDDCFTHSRQAEATLQHLWQRGRHFKISVLSAGISYINLNKNCRRSLDLILLYSSVCRSDMDAITKEFITSQISVAKYCIQHFEPYCALVIEAKRNQVLYQLKFKIHTKHCGESLLQPDSSESQGLVEPLQKTTICPVNEISSWEDENNVSDNNLE